MDCLMDASPPPRRITACEVIDVLTPIFQRVLRRASVGPNDDFFDLGGDSLLALNLILEIERSIGIVLSPTVLFDAPTIASVADIIETTSVESASPLALLRSGTGGPPLFIAHGISGTAFDLVPLARRLETKRPVYGLQAPGIDGTSTPLSRIEDLARFHLNVIRRIQPEGPYVLAGYSMGGFIALEMAQLLAQVGQRVAQLIILDTQMPLRQLSVAGRLKFWGRRTQFHARILKKLRPRDAIPYTLGRLRGFAHDFLPSETLRRLAKRDRAVLPEAAKRVREAGIAATTVYRPRFYNGPITFIEAERDQGIPSYPDITWGNFTNDLKLYRIEANHWTMMSVDVDKLVGALSDCLVSSDRSNESVEF